jgi:DNA-binding transcriptional regulator YbjK
VIADAAISVLALEGARGLTHRALDRHLQLPDGSTSYYFRTRQALLAAATARLLLLDSLDASDFEMSAAGLSRMCQRWSTGTRRERAIARLELFLAAARSPEFDAIHAAREFFLAGADAKLREISASSPRSAAVAVVALMDGLLIHSLVLGPLREHELKHITSRVLEAFADDSVPRKPKARTSKRRPAARVQRA